MENFDVRREARRRKILENAEKRLQKITGVENKSNKLDGTDIPSLKHFQTSKEISSSHVLDNHSYVTEEEEDEIPNLYTQSDTTYNDIETLNLGLNKKTLESPVESKLNNFYNLVLPIIWSLLLTIGDILHVNTNSFYLNRIFIPLIVFEMQDYYFSSNRLNTSSFVSHVLTLLNKTHSKYINFVVQFLLKIFQDVMIYFFVFTVSYQLMHCLFLL